jgi:hypothetical protein
MTNLDTWRLTERAGESYVVAGQRDGISLRRVNGDLASIAIIRDELYYQYMPGEALEPETVGIRCGDILAVLTLDQASEIAEVIQLIVANLREEHRLRGAAFDHSI